MSVFENLNGFVRAASAVALMVSAAWAQELRVTVEPGTTMLALDGAASFHATASEIRGARLVAVDGTSVRAALWEERGSDGQFAPWYAIFLDGRHAAVVTATSYALHLRRATFDPLEGEPSFAGSPFGWDGGTYIVQFATQPLAEYQEALRAAGATLHRYLPEHAQIVSMSQAVHARVAALPCVRWIGPYHGEYKLDPAVLAELAAGDLSARRYNVQVLERGLAQKESVAGKIVRLGGRIDALIPSGFLIEATFSPQVLREVSGFDEVEYVDLWSEPGTDLDIARQISGADYVELSIGFDGSGVRGEVMDGGVLTNHAAFQSAGGVLMHTPNDSFTSHGTSTTGCVFGDGTANPAGRGILAGAEIVFASYLHYTDRYVLTADLVNPLGGYQCVFQSNSWGDSQVTTYNSKSFEMDDIIFLNDIIICQSQSNLNSQLSRPQAWAKNVVSVGGINHFGTLSKSDDNWNGASIGPAEDGRIKPDLAHFYDSILCTDSFSTTAYTCCFGGTSGATPIVAGYFGIFFKLWHQGVFGNQPNGPTVFSSKPHSSLAKAALINTASSYSFTGTAHNLTRTHQGWGLPDVARLYDERSRTFWIDQTDPVDNLGSRTYLVDVAAGEDALRATMVYRDPAGTVAASQHRINDLSLKVTEPNGTTLYWGNNGLLAGNWSSTGGVANTKDTVENVFVRLPVAGTWTIEVVGTDVNTDIRFDVAGNNADFALWVTGATAHCISPTNYCTGKVNTNGQTPAISFTGTPSFTVNDFALALTNGTFNKSALYFHSAGQASFPFQGGILCAQPPLIRGPVLTTDAAGSASSPFDVELGDVGTTRYFQWWMRDPADPFTTGLSDALSVQICN